MTKLFANGYIFPWLNFNPIFFNRNSPPPPRLGLLKKTTQCWDTVNLLYWTAMKWNANGRKDFMDLFTFTKILKEVLNVSFGLKIMDSTDFNFSQQRSLLYRKPIHWFAGQINELVSMWQGPLSSKKLTHFMPLFVFHTAWKHNLVVF